MSKTSYFLRAFFLLLKETGVKEDYLQNVKHLPTSSHNITDSLTSFTWRANDYATRYAVYNKWLRLSRELQNQWALHGRKVDGGEGVVKLVKEVL